MQDEAKPVMTRREFGTAGAALAAVLGSGVAGAASPERLRTALDPHVDRREVPGLVALLGQGTDTIVHAAGVQSLESGTPMRRDTIFRVASITKPITAAAVMMLVEEGRFGLDDPVEKWLPELADRRVVRSLDGPIDDTVPAARSITVRDLLAMRMGLGAIFTDPASSPLLKRFAELELAPGATLFPHSEDEFLRRLGSLPLACHPGEKWLYHTGMDVAGVLIARASGKPLGTFLQERIFGPLGMRDTSFFVPADKLARLADLYARNSRSGALERGNHGFDVSKRPSMEHGGGGLASTVDDFNAFGRMLLGRGTYRGRRILSAQSVAEMTRDQIPAAVKAMSPFFPDFWKTNSWGLGIGVVTAADAIAAHPGRFGWFGGTGTTFFADPKTDRVVVLMFQRMMTSPDDTRIGNEFLSLALKGER
jgi:CubicO group peptidase (beta-lactamase class C family)